MEVYYENYIFGNKSWRSTSKQILFVYFAVESIVEILLACPTKKVAIMHVGRDINRALQYIEDMGKTSKVPLFAPNDGDVIET